jgi:hypothetical protein
MSRGQGSAERDGKARAPSVVTRVNVQLSADLLHQRQHDLHSKSFAGVGIESGDHGVFAAKSDLGPPSGPTILAVTMPRFRGRG